MCRLERFDLSGNAGLDQSTLAGFLAYTMRPDVTRIDAANKGFKGECALCVGPVMSTSHCLLMLLHSLPSGQVSNEVFGLLCQLEHFDLSGNPALDQTTLVGYLACTMTNLKDATEIDVMNKSLKGECALCVEPSIHAFVRFADISTMFCR